MKQQLKVEEFLKTANYKRSLSDFCFCYYEWYIESESDKVALNNFIKLLEWNKNSDESLDLDEMMPKDMYREIIDNLLPIIQKIVDKLILERLSEKEFYAVLYNNIMDNILFSKKEEKICAIIILMLEPRIPYFYLDEAIKMEDDDYKSASDSIYKHISKAYFILEYGYEQNTEVASQLYRLVKEQSSENDKIVLISNIIGFFNAKIKILYDKLIQESE